MKKIGIFSGTFDPIHAGHVGFMRHAQKVAGLDGLLLMVEQSPWRKQPVATFEQRLAMAEIAVRGITGAHVLDQSIVRVGERHDVQTVMPALHEHFPDVELTMLVGGDVFEHIQSWKGYRELLETVSFVVALRTEDDGEIITPLIKQVGAEATVVVSPLPHVSSSKVRSGEVKPGGYVMPEIQNYINAAGLYG